MELKVNIDFKEFLSFLDSPRNAIYIDMLKEWLSKHYPEPVDEYENYIFCHCYDAWKRAPRGLMEQPLRRDEFDFIRSLENGTSDIIQ
jgi:hypothetical protein